MPGHVDGHNEKSECGDTVEQSQIMPTVEAEAVQENHGHAVATDRDPDLEAVVEFEHVMLEAHPSSREIGCHRVHPGSFVLARVYPCRAFVNLMAGSRLIALGLKALRLQAALSTTSGAHGCAE
ncbi:hypothetical protein RMCFA_1211 [Mycolicibacterium fortuitum subsp. acetamidolyticum]|uniref:Uncharacterized protein n=1 Tax=Mycolicibacterium fortuitum subsp. acetamidolyticum TaxID=144550 RepID=A0A100WMV8_MYCFO|nr:hypothetical protein RMCFA_1211 [Mycolicibacterium fortuitum subsp. acetamidolyticum]